MKSYTDLEQSSKLSEILSVESADIWWAERYKGEVTENGQYIVDEEPYYYLSLINPSENNCSQDQIKSIPCWSLSTLINVLPKEIEIDGQRYAPCLFPVQDKWLLKLWYNSNYTIESPIAIFSDNLIDAYYEMILKLYERKML